MQELKVVLITQGVSRVVKPLLESDHQIVGVIESATRDAINKKQPSLMYKVARYLYSKIKKQTISLEKFSTEKSIPYRYMLSSNDAGLEDWVKNLNPDVIVVFSMSQLLKENIFSIPKLGAINMHPAMLPDYRGPNPDVWQYINLEMNPGVTIHYIDKGEDTGDILNQERVHIPLGTKSPERLDKLLGEVGVRNLLKTLDELANGTQQPVKQPEQSPTARARNIKQEEHKKIIDWKSWETTHIWHVLRGTELWLNALEQPKGIYKGQRWSIGDYHITNSQQHPAETIYKTATGYAVATRDGHIDLSLTFSFKKLILALLKK